MDSDELLVEGTSDIYENKTKAIFVAMEVRRYLSLVNTHLRHISELICSCVA